MGEWARDCFLNRKQDSGGEDDQGHGDGAGEGAHHDDGRREIFVVLEFDGVEDGIHRGRHRTHDEDGLADDGRKSASECIPECEKREGERGASDEADENGEPGFSVGKGNFAAVNLHAECHHDNGDEGGGAIFENRPKRRRGHVKADNLNRENGEERVDDGHVENDAKRIGGREASFAGLVEADGIQK